MTFILRKNTFQFLAITLIILKGFTSNLYAQESTIQMTDSLLNMTTNEFVQFLKNSKKGEAVFFEKVVLKRAKDPTGLVDQELGRRFSKEENYGKAHHYLDIALNLTKKNNDKKRTCVVLILKANAFMLDGQNEEAVITYNKAITIAEKYSYSKLGIMATSNYISLISQMVDQSERALRMSDELLIQLKEYPDKNTKNYVQMLATVNDVFLGAEQYDKVVRFADEGIAIADSLDYVKAIADMYVKKGIAYYYKNEKKKSRLFLDKAKTIIDGNELDNDFHQKVRIYYFLAKQYHDDGDYTKAIVYLTKIIDTAKEEDTNKLPVIQTYNLLAYSYKGLGNDKKAWEYFEIYDRLDKIYEKSEGKTRNRVFEKEENAANERIVLEKTNKIYTQIVLCIVFMLLLIVGYSFWRKQKKNKTLFNNLISQIDQLESQQQHEKPQKNKKIAVDIAIDNDKINAVLKGLAKLEKQEYFLKSDCNLRTIAKKTKTNATYLSKIINTHKGKNFNGYINDLRIEYALSKLKNDKRFRSFSVASIALEVGYKSDKSFVKHFKSKTGINPSYYIKNIENLKNNAA